MEEAEIPAHNNQPVIAVLVQPGSTGNRVLIGYEHGVIILWDVSRCQVVVVRGIRNLQLKDEVAGSQDEEKNKNANLDEKEIGTLCWASSDGSVIAVGYLDGDILLWNMSSTTPSKSSKGKSNHDVVKLQLSSAEKRLPVIALHWSPKSGSTKGRDGILFVYGGDEIGAEEVLTVMCLEWVSGTETLRCAVRLDLTLHGTFSDMILLGTNYARGKNHETHFCLLTNPGELHYYDDSILFNNHERKSYVSSIAHPFLIQFVDPDITATRLCLVRSNLSKYLTELALAKKSGRQFSQPDSVKWPVTGGIPSQLFTGCDAIERVFIAGYQDGSIRIYDATYSTLSLLCLLEPKLQVPGISVAGSDAPVTEIDICCQSSVISVGNECGLVRIYNLTRCSADASFQMITENKNEGHQLLNIKRNIYRAAVCVRNSAISALKFSNDAPRLAIGYGCGSIAVLDVKILSILFIIDQAFGSFPVKSMMWNEFSQSTAGVLPSKSIPNQDSGAELLFILTMDSKIKIVDGQSGKVLKSQPLQLKMGLHVISLYSLEQIISVREASPGKEPDQSTKHTAPKSEYVQPGESFNDPLIILCCADSIHIYSAKSVTQGTAPTILGVVKGFKGGKSHNAGSMSSAASASYAHLELIFSQPPPPLPDLLPVSDHQEVELNLDDILIEEPVSVLPSSSHGTKNHEKNKGKINDRGKLLQGVTSETVPRVRTPEEILAAYRKTGDASSAAARARSKLVERQAKLEKISKGAEDLQNGAENFASLANELVKAMEERNNRKWWNL